MRWSVVVAVAVAVTGPSLMAGDAQAADLWSSKAEAAPGPASVIGSAAAGCLAGAKALPQDGAGYQVLRPGRNRFYGHPSLIAFVEALGRDAAAAKLGLLLVGDLAQPRGGPMPFGHGSHQTGLDVDIWFRLAAGPLPPEEREAPVPVSMVKGDRIDKAAWQPGQIALLELAARAPEVDRIFVNPAIKREACRSAAGNRGWLAKLRPWWGHDEHFHVRLSCPSGDFACEPQQPVPDGDGCGAELDSWFAKGGTAIPTEKPHHQAKALPAACTAVMRK